MTTVHRLGWFALGLTLCTGLSHCIGLLHPAKASGKSRPYFTSVQNQALIPGIDIDQTLSIADDELRKGGFSSVLTLWGARDQVYTEAQAKRVADIYFRYVDQEKGYFRLWHLTWAISDIYRNGNAAVRAPLELAYADAKKRAAAAGGIANLHVNGKILMGDIHRPARAFVESRLVVPGDKTFLQSYEEYRRKSP